MTAHTNSVPKMSELRTLLANVLDRDEATIGDDAHFVRDLGVDSIMTIEILVALERRYKIKLPEQDLKRLTDLRGVHQLLLEKQGAKA